LEVGFLDMNVGTDGGRGVEQEPAEVRRRRATKR
jgi:hypothetical protein